MRRFRRVLCLVLAAAFIMACALPAQAEYRELKQGMSGSDVLSLKQAMYYLGYFTSLNLSDSYNSTMVQRVKNLQKANGLEQTGIADAALQALVFSGQCVPADGAPAPTPVPASTEAPAFSPEPTPAPTDISIDILAAQASYRELKQGMSGSDVLSLKQAMYYLGYFTSLDLSDSYNSIMVQRVKNLQKANGLEQTGIADAALQALVFSGQCVPTDGAPAPTAVPTPSPSPTPAPTPIPVQSLPDYPDELTDEVFLPQGEEAYVYQNETDGLWVYLSDSLSVEIRRYTDTQNTLEWFETEIYCSPDSPLTSYLSEGKTPGSRAIDPITLAQNNNVVLGITDDFFGSRRNNNETVGIVIRNGQIISDKTYTADRPRFPNLEVLAVFDNGSMKAYLSNAYTAEEYLSMGVTDTFAFGPILVSEGQLGAHMQDDTYYHYLEPRCALGMIEPYHYIILTVKGRVKSSKGVYLNWLAEKMLEKGAVEALNLDGGGTVALVFMGNILNKTGKTMRGVTSIIGFGVAEE